MSEKIRITVTAIQNKFILRNITQRISTESFYCQWNAAKLKIGEGNYIAIVRYFCQYTNLTSKDKISINVPF